MSILTIDCFKEGRFKIPLSTKGQLIGLPEYLNDVECTYLPRLLGVELYNLFLADLALPAVGEPTDPRFVKIYEKIMYDFDTCVTIHSKGIKRMLQGFVYYHYVRDNNTVLTNSGAKKTKSANSADVSLFQHDILGRYNEAVDTFKAIQNYICHVEPENYPEFKGQIVDYNHPF